MPWSVSLPCCVPWPPNTSDTHRMASCTCWIATSASNQSRSAFKAARTSLTWSSPVKRESMTKWWRVRLLIRNATKATCENLEPLGTTLLWYMFLPHNDCIHIPHCHSLSLPCCCSSDLNSREQETLQPVHVINVEIQDNHEEATLGAFLICELCQCVSVSEPTQQYEWTHSGHNLE